MSLNTDVNALNGPVKVQERATAATQGLWERRRTFKDNFICFGTTWIPLNKSDKLEGTVNWIFSHWIPLTTRMALSRVYTSARAQQSLLIQSRWNQTLIICVFISKFQSCLRPVKQNVTRAYVYSDENREITLKCNTPYCVQDVQKASSHSVIKLRRTSWYSSVTCRKTIINQKYPVICPFI